MTDDTRTCRTCGADLTGSHSNRIYCDPQCRKATPFTDKKKAPEGSARQVACPYCNAEFTALHHLTKYCCPEHATKDGSRRALKGGWSSNPGPCAVSDCPHDNPPYIKGFCRKHWWRYDQYGDPLGNPKTHEPIKGKVICKVESGCTEYAVKRGYCDEHHVNWIATGRDHVAVVTEDTPDALWCDVHEWTLSYKGKVPLCIHCQRIKNRQRDEMGEPYRLFPFPDVH